jgi:hypothetical protein
VGPFVPAGVFATSFSVYLYSSTKMALTSYKWTSGDCTSHPVAVIFESTISTVTPTLKLSNDGSTWQVEPLDYNTIQDHSFSILVSGTDGAGAIITETHGPYTMRVIPDCTKSILDTGKHLS